MPRIEIAVVLLATVLPFAAEAAGADEHSGRRVYAEPSPLASLIDQSREMSAAARLDLAVLLVDTLVAAYESELDNALREAARHGDGAVASWIGALARYLDELRGWQAALYVASEVELDVERHDQVLVLIDGRPFWTAWPRAGARSRLERSLAEEFCRRHACEGELPWAAGHRLEDPAAPAGAWVLSQFSPPAWERADGLRCEFPDYGRLAERERDCQAVAADLEALALALRATQRAGERVDWTGLRIAASGADGQHRVVINERGDYVVAYLPALASLPVDWHGAGHWMAARVEGKSASATVLRASSR
jgi:hypothetical protein